MRSLKLTLSYDGTEYCGWQAQPNGPTIQQAIERALAKVLQQRIRVTASGRTDSGVHALAQVASCEVDTEMTTEQLCRAINGNLPPDIRILRVETAADGFHAIRDALAKRYRYRLQDGDIHDVFRRRYTWFIRGQIDAAAMHSAGRLLIGSHDFQSFQAAGSDRKTTIRNVMDLSVCRSHVHSDEIVLEIEADGFLYNMVRNIVGTLVEVGLHNQSVQWPDEVRGARNRKVAGRTAPPHGLFLVGVTYSLEANV